MFSSGWIHSCKPSYPKSNIGCLCKGDGEGQHFHIIRYNMYRVLCCRGQCIHTNLKTIPLYVENWGTDSKRMIFIISPKYKMAITSCRFEVTNFTLNLTMIGRGCAKDKTFLKIQYGYNSLRFQANWIYIWKLFYPKLRREAPSGKHGKKLKSKNLLSRMDLIAYVLKVIAIVFGISWRFRLL